MTTLPVGRPRNEALTENVLNATYRLLSDHRYADISLVKIAETAGVSRKALYSRWQNKCELIIDAFNLFHPPAMPERTGSVKNQLIDYIEQSMSIFNQDIVLFRDVLADILQQPATLAFFEQAFSRPRQTCFREMLQAGIENGEFPPNLDLSLTIECLNAVFRQKILLAEKIERPFIQTLVEFLLK